MKWLTKQIEVPISNNVKTVDAVQLWEVRWESRHGEYSHDVRPEVEGFPTQEEADEFATSLTNALKLIRHTNIQVTVRKAI